MAKNPTPAGRVGADVTTRPIRKADVAFAEALYLATMLPLLTDLGRGNVDLLRARFAQGYRPKRSRIPQVSGTDVGWLQLSTGSAGYHLDQLHLLPAWRRLGIGSVLIGRILRRAGRAGVTVGLDVVRGNPALGLYRRLGFHVVAEDDQKYGMLWRPPVVS